KAFEAYNEYVSSGLIHTGISEDTVTDVYRAMLNNSQSELNSLIANNALNTTFDFTYTGFSTQSQVNTTLEYVINQSGNQLADETIPVSMTIQPNVCVNQTATYPLNMDLSNVLQGAFVVDILLNGSLIANYNLEMLSTVSEFNLAKDIVLFPTPIQNQLNISLPKPYKIINAQIINTTGQVLLETYIKNKNAFQLQLNNLSPGVYFLKLDVDGFQVAKKLIKE
ncbi:MAG: T9SS type A sorting domain-containing protein, partial [Cyclobacteriaceae bacterium]|nr:T9SS type A sorting domain-containing protein [Cyclobacteriaceae bacterium]